AEAALTPAHADAAIGLRPVQFAGIEFGDRGAQDAGWHRLAAAEDGFVGDPTGELRRERKCAGKAQAETRDPAKPPGDPPAPLERYFDPVIGQQGQPRAFSGEFGRVGAGDSSAVASEVDMVHARGPSVFI